MQASKHSAGQTVSQQNSNQKKIRKGSRSGSAQLASAVLPVLENLEVRRLLSAAAGTLDANFAVAGKQITDFGSGSEDVGQAVAIDTTQGNDIVVAGARGGQFAISVYTPSGSLVTFTAISSLSGTSQANAVTIDSAGRIVAAGYVDTGPTTNNDFLVARFNLSGSSLSLDTSFGGTGYVVNDINGGRADEANGVAIASNGDIIAAGTSGTDGSARAAILAYTPAGVLDSAFNGTGKVVTSGAPDSVNAVTIDNGNIIAVGRNSTHAEMVVVNSTGTSVTRYALNLGSGDSANAVAPAGGGDVYIAGSSDGNFVLAEAVESTGSLVGGFGTSGETETVIGTFAQANSIAVQANGKIDVAGYENDLSNRNQFAVVRYSSTGAIDSTAFGTSGIATTDFSGNDSADSIAKGIVIQPNGLIVAAGTTAAGANPDNIAVARYVANNSPTNAAATANFSQIVEGDIISPGNTIADLAAQLGIGDIDGDAVGVAVTGTGDPANGTWQFSTDSGSTWTPISGASDAHALVLGSSTANAIRFVPVDGFNGPESLSLRAYDRSQGYADGSYINAFSSTDATADSGSAGQNLNSFGDNTLTANINVAPAPLVVYVNTTWTGSVQDSTVTDVHGSHTFFIDAFPTIQDGIQYVASGGTVIVDAGVYAENINVNKPVTLQGAQVGSDANARFSAFTNAGAGEGLKANATLESIITAPSVAPEGNAGAPYDDLLRVTVANVTIDGFVIDGNNANLTQTGADTVNGVKVDARRGIDNIDSSGGFNNPVSNLQIKNNIIQNFGDRGISLYNNGTNPAVNNLVEGNVVRDFANDGVILFTNAYTDVENNTISTPDNAIGLQLQNFFNASDSMTWSGNTITVGNAGIGIHVNLFYATASTLNITNNTINAAADAVGNTGLTWGINIWSVQVGSTVTLSGNTVGATNNGGTFDRGINFWNLPTSNTVSLSGGSIADSTVGIDLDNVDPYFGAGADTSVNVSGVSITGGTIGVRVRDEALDSAEFGGAILPIQGGSNAPGGNVSMSLTGVTISGAATGVFVQGGDVVPVEHTASVQISGGSSISGGITGIELMGDYASLTGNTLANTSFSGQSGDYVTLADGSESGPQTIDATHASFDGFVGSIAILPADLATAYGVEDKITDYLDNAGVGYVSLNANNVFLAHSSETGSAGSVQRGVNVAPSGGTVYVQAGTYVGGATVDNTNSVTAGIVIGKPLSLIGPNTAFNPLGNTTPAYGQAIIEPGASNPNPNTADDVVVIEVESSNVTIQGLTVSGSNASISHNGGVVLDGVPIDAAEGIVSYTGVGNINVSNNVVENTAYTGVDFYNFDNSIATSDNTISNNYITNLSDFYGFGVGLLVYNNFYAQVNDNVISNALVGVQTGNFNLGNPDGGFAPSISYNHISAAGVGIFYNLMYQASGPFTVANNTITAINAPSDAPWQGVLLTSIQDNVSVTFTDNSIDGTNAYDNSGAQPSSGYEVWNTPSTGSILISGGTVSHVDYGVWINTFEGYDSNADATHATISGVNITAKIAGVYVEDSPQNTAPVDVSATINGGTVINAGTGVGVLVSGASASAVITNTSIDPPIAAHGTGILVSGGSATISDDSFSDLATGVEFTAGGSGSLAGSTFTGNLVDLLVDATAGSVTIDDGNSFNGLNYSIENLSSQNFDLSGYTQTSINNVNLQGASLAQLFTIEDNIVDAIDVSGYGLVRLQAGNIFVTPNSFFAPGGTSDDSGSIQRGINAAAVSDIVNVETGTYAGLVNVNKSVSLQGSGTPTISGPLSSSRDVTISASNVTINNFNITGGDRGIELNSALSGITLSNLSLSGVGTDGIEVDNSAVLSNITLTSVSVSTNAVSGTGFNVSTTGQVNGLHISGGHFDHNEIGLYTNATSSITNNQIGFTNILIDGGATFSNDTLKGIYVEKLDNATFNGIVVANSGTSGSSSAGIDINLKYGTYANGITIENSTLTNDGTGSVTGAGLAIKGRNDAPSYNGNPASLSNVTLTSDTISGSPIDLSIGNNVSGISFSGVVLNDGGIGLVYYATASDTLNLGNTIFDGALSLYIENGSTNGIDATGATFGSVAPADNTLSDLYGVEDKIVDAIDVSGAGLVRLRTGNVYVTPNSFFLPLTSTPSIQRAVDAATSGDTVNIENGPAYVGQVAISGKSLTLLGQSEAGVVIRSPVTLNTEFTISTPNDPIVYANNGTVNVEYLTIDGAKEGNGNYRFMGLAYYNASGLADHLTVENVSENPLNGDQHGNAIYAYNNVGSNTLTVSNDNVFGYQKNGITANGAGLTAYITDNTVTGDDTYAINGQNGIQIGFGALGHVSGNTISGDKYSVVTHAAAGILLYSAAAGTTVDGDNSVSGSDVGISSYSSSAVIDGNSLTDNTIGLLVDSGTARVQNNIITSDGEGVVVQDGATVDLGTDASDTGHADFTGLGSSTGHNTLTGYTGSGGNYAIDDHNTPQGGEPDVLAEDNNFGPYPASDPGIIGELIHDNADDSSLTTVFYLPALNEQTAPATVYVNAAWTGSAFGSDPGALGGGSSFGYNEFSDVQDAINAVADGGTVNIANGTYDPSNILISKSLTIQGASENGTIITPSLTDSHDDSSFGGAVVSNGFIIASSGVTIKNLTLDGGANQNFRDGIITNSQNDGHTYNNITIENVTVQNAFRKGIAIYNESGLATGITIENDTLNNIGTIINDGGAYEATAAIAVFGSNALVENNVITNSAGGIEANTFDGSAQVLTITGNSISAPSTALANGALGIDAASLAAGSTVSHNTVDLTGRTGTGTGNDIGIVVSFDHGAVTVANDSVTGAGSDDGILLYEDATAVTLDQNIISGASGTGILVTANSGDTSRFGDAGGTVAADITANTVTGFAVAIEVAGGSGVGNTAAANIGDGTGAGSNSISGAGDGIVVTGSQSTATISDNSIFDNTTGVEFTAGGGGSIAGNTFSGATDNGTDLLVDTTAGAVTINDGNTFAGSTDYIENDSTQNFDLSGLSTTTFGGFNAVTTAVTGGNLGSFYGVEDKIVDYLDNPAVGYVRIKSGYDFVTQLSETTNADAIQRGVNAAATNDIVDVQAGTFAGLVNVNKPLDLEGAQASQDAVTRAGNFVGGSANPAVETIITSSSADGGTAASDLVNIQAGNVTIDGFVLDGSFGGYGAHNGIATVDSSGNGHAVNNLLIENNIVQNVGHDGIALINPSDGSAVTGGSLITGNVVRGFVDYGVLLAYNAYADVTSNTITMPNLTEAGVWVYDFTANGNTPATQTVNVSLNNVTVGQDAFGGIWANLDYSPSATLNITNNTVNAASGVTGTDGFTFGLYLSSLQNGFQADLSGNTVGATGGQFAAGIDIWNAPTASPTIVSGGSIGNSIVGIQVDNDDINFGSGDSTTVDITGVSISGSTTGVLASGDATGAGTIIAAISADTISGAATGIEISGPKASATITGTSIDPVGPTGTGILVSGGSASITGDTLSGLATGIEFTTGGSGSVTGNTFTGNSVDLLIDSSAGSVAINDGNSFNGLNYSIENLSSQNFDLSGYTQTSINNVNLQGASLSQLFTIEDNIVDAIDVSGYGLVRLQAGNIFVTPNSFFAPGGTSDDSGSIQRGINAAAVSDIVNVETGTYQGLVNVNKSVTLEGSGTPTISAPLSSSRDVTISASNVTINNFNITGGDRGIELNSALSGITLSNLSLSGVGTDGIEVDNSAVLSNITLTSVSVSTNAVSGTGFNVSTTGQVNGLHISGGHFDHNEIGLYTNATSSITNNQIGFTNILIDGGATFSNDTLKGIYVEKLDNATFNGIVVANSGTSGSSSAGIDINLKYGTYANGITIENSTLTNDGTGSVTGAGLAIKGRNDAPSYNGNPASLSNVTLTSDTISGSPIDLSIGYNISGISLSGVVLNDGGIGLVYYATASDTLNLGNTIFDGALSEYIENGSTNGITATGATFGSVIPTDNTLSDLYGVEDKIIDAIDVSGLGLVRLRTGNVYVTPNSFEAPYTTTPSIQRGINAASVNDIVNVEAGVYSGDVNVNKKVDLKGAGAGIAAPTRFIAESTISSPDGTTELQISVNDATVDGFAISGNTNANVFGAGVYMVPGISGTQFVNNIVRDNIVGLFLANASATDQAVISGNLFENNTNPGAASGSDIYADQYTAGSGGVQDVLIEDNTFTNSTNVADSWGVAISNTASVPFSNIDLESNRFENSGRGAYFFGSADVTVNANTFTGNTHYGLGIFGSGGTPANSGFVVTGNSFTSDAAGLEVVDDTPGTAYTGSLTLTGNIFASSTTTYIDDESTASFDASDNTFGGYTPTAANLAGQYALEDRIIDGIDVGGFGLVNIDPTFLNVYVTPNSFYIPGGTSTPSIQRGVDLASNGDTVNVQGGLYEDGTNNDTVLNINKSVAVIGTDGAAATTINGNSIGNDYYVVIISASNTQLSGFTITNPVYDGTADASGVVVEPVDIHAPISNIEISDDIIHDIGTLSRTSAYATLGVNIEDSTSNVTVDDDTIYNIGNADPGSFAIGILTAGDPATPANGVQIEGDSIYDVFNSDLAAAIDTGSYSQNVTIENNFLGVGDATPGNIGYGVRTSSSNADGIAITANEIENAGVAGIQLNSPLSETVYRNTIENNVIGLEITSGANLTSATQNFFTDNGTGIQIDDGAASVGPINDNSITGNTTAGLNNETSGLSKLAINADYNWWGSATGPTNPLNPAGTGDTIIDDPSVSFSPWLTDGTDTQPATPGFQPNDTAAVSISGSSTGTEGATYNLTLSPSSDITGWSINWGDGDIQAITGAPTSVPHVFAEYGPYTISAIATTTSSGPVASNNVNVNVHDATLTLSSVGVSATEGSPFVNAAVATLTDAAGSYSNPSDLSATIDWGDASTPSNATLVPLGNGLYTVKGSHTYVEAGNYTLTVTVTDNDGNPGGSTTSTPTGTATVADAALNATPADSISATEGAAISDVVVATLTDAAGADSNPADLSATIDWGDTSPTSSATLIPLGNGVYTVEGSHTYTEEGAYTVVVSFTDAKGSTTSTHLGASVADAALTAGSLTPPVATEGQAFSNTTVFHFTDANSFATADDFTAIVTLGDGSHVTLTSTAGANGQVVASGGGFDVQLSYTYADELNNQTFAVNVSDDGGSTTSASTATFSVADAALTAGALTPPVATEGTGFTSVTIFHFTDADPSATTADYTATVTLGDGNTVILTAAATANGQIVTHAGGGFDVLLTYTYTDELSNQTFSVNVADNGGSTTSGSTATFSVSDAALTAGSLTPPVATEGAGFTNVTIFHFTDANPLATTADYSALVTLGDGSQVTLTGTAGPNGQIVSNAGGGFDVKLTYTYSDELSSQIFAVNVSDDGLSTTSGSTASFSVADAALTAGALTPPTATEGAPFTNVTIFHFTDANPLATTADFSALVTLGDGQQVTLTSVAGPNGQVVAHAGGGFDVLLSYTYAEQFSNQTFAVNVTDDGGSATSASTATFSVADAALNLSLSAPNTLEGIVLSNTTVATLTDAAGASSNINDLSATIHWGDGAVTSAILAPTATPGVYNVTGSHTYGDEFTGITFEVDAVDSHGSSTSKTTSINVGDNPPTVDLSASANASNEGATYTLDLNNAADPGPNNILGYIVSWGDGHITGSPTAGAPPATLTHTFDDGPASENILVTLYDEDGPHPSAGSKSVSVHNVAPTATIQNGLPSVPEGSPGFVSLVSPSDPSSADTSAGFTYTFFVTNTLGTFQVQQGASNSASIPATFIDTPGTYVITADITDKDGGTTVYTTNVAVTNLAPNVNSIADFQTTSGTPWTQGGSFTDQGVDPNWLVYVNYDAINNPGLGTLVQNNASHSFTLGTTYNVSSITTFQVQVTVEDLGGPGNNAASLSGTTTFNVTVKPSTFHVVTFAKESSGFMAQLNRPADLSTLNIYSGGTVPAYSSTDVTLVGNSSGTITGSLIWVAATDTLEFIKTGNVNVPGSSLLAPDTYTVTLSSGSSAFRDTSGNLLDGNDDGTAGDDYTTTFTIAPTGDPVTVPYFARGPGQPVNLPANSSNGIPISITPSAGQLVDAVDFDLIYDPNLLTISGESLPAALVSAGWSFAVNSNLPGDLSLSIFSTNSSTLSIATQSIINIAASVPSGAPYGSSDALQITKLRINEGAIAGTGNQAVDKAAFLGDASGNKGYSGLDASLIANVVVNNFNGFDAYPLTDPVIIGDVTGDGTLSGQDASDVAQESIHINIPQIPALPAGNTPVLGPVIGLDPTLTVGSVNIAPNSTGNVPINISDATGVQSFNLQANYDQTKLSLGNGSVTNGSVDTAGLGWTVISNIDNADGIVYIAGYTTGSALAGGTGSMANMQFAVANGAAAGNSAVTLSPSPTSFFNEGNPPLSVANGNVNVVVPTLNSFTINDGNVQRSRIDSLTLTFNEPVTLSAGAITVNQVGGGAMPYTLSTTDNQTYVLTFPTLFAKSLPDGQYFLNVLGSAVQDGVGNTLSGGDQKFGFHCLYGDFLGRSQVSFNELLFLAQHFEVTNASPLYVYYVDYNNDGIIDFQDLLAFAQHNNDILSDPTSATLPATASISATSAVLDAIAVPTVTTTVSKSVASVTQSAVVKPTLRRRRRAALAAANQTATQNGLTTNSSSASSPAAPLSSMSADILYAQPVGAASVLA